VAQLVEALRYKPKGRRFYSRFLLAALWLTVKQKWVPGIPPGGKSGRRLWLTALSP